MESCREIDAARKPILETPALAAAATRPVTVIVKAVGVASLLAALLYVFPTGGDLGAWGWVLAVLTTNFILVTIFSRVRHHGEVLPLQLELTDAARRNVPFRLPVLCLAFTCSYLVVLEVPRTSHSAMMPPSFIYEAGVIFLLSLLERLHRLIPSNDERAWGLLAVSVSLVLFLLVCGTSWFSRDGGPREGEGKWMGLSSASHGVDNKLLWYRNGTSVVQRCLLENWK